jgi:hypothetical protein
MPFNAEIGQSRRAKETRKGVAGRFVGAGIDFRPLCCFPWLSVVTVWLPEVVVL